MTTHGDSSEMVVGFVMECEREEVVVFALKEGLVLCPRESFHDEDWRDIYPGQWMTLTMTKIQPDNHYRCPRKAVQALPLTQDPPVVIWLNTEAQKQHLQSLWIANVRAVVCSVFPSFGLAWSPLLGHIQIPRKFLDKVRPLEEVEVDVHLPPLQQMTGRGPPRRHWNWILFRITSHTIPDVSVEVRAGHLPELRLFRARISFVSREEWGHAEPEDPEEGPIYFEREAFSPSDGVRSLRETAKLGSLWTILVAEREERGRREHWRALAFSECIQSEEMDEKGEEEYAGCSEWSLSCREVDGWEESGALSLTTHDIHTQTDETFSLRHEEDKERELLRKRLELLEIDTRRWKEEFLLSSEQKAQIKAEVERLEAEGFKPKDKAMHEQVLKLQEKYRKEAEELRREIGELRGKGREEETLANAQLRHQITELEDRNEALLRTKTALSDAGSGEKRMVEAGTETERSQAGHLIARIYGDEDLFPFICQKSPDLVRDFFKAMQHTPTQFSG